MATKATTTAGNGKTNTRVSLSKSKMHQTAEEIEELAELEAAGAGAEMTEGLMVTLEAEDVRTFGRAVGAVGAGDIVGGADKMKVAEVAAILSEVSAGAGRLDLADGAAALAASEDIAVQSAVLGALSEEDLVVGMKLASIAGQLRAARNVVAVLGMPVLTEFLADKSDELEAAATDGIFRMAATRALARALRSVGLDIADVGADEVAEGLSRLSLSAAAAERSEQLARSGATQIVEGILEMEAAEEIEQAAKEQEAAAIAEIAQGAEAYGQAETMNVVATQLDKASK